MSKFKIYRRNLPHWCRPESVYFITFRTFKQVILTEEARDITFNSILFHNNKKYKLYTFVIMPDHVHLLLYPLEKTKNAFYSLSEILHSIKSYSANQINKLLKSAGKMPVPPRNLIDKEFYKRRKYLVAKQKTIYTIITLALIISLFMAAAPLRAGDAVKKITFSELSALLESNRGKVVVVALWATWCPPCRKEIPGFINLYNKYKDKGVEIIGIAFDENGESAVPPFITKTGINYPVYLEGKNVAQAYDLRAYPTTVIYDKNGKLVNKHVGYASEEDFDKEISSLLNK